MNEQTNSKARVLLSNTSEPVEETFRPSLQVAEIKVTKWEEKTPLHW